MAGGWSISRIVYIKQIREKPIAALIISDNKRHRTHTHTHINIYINWLGSFVSGQFPRSKQQSNRTFRSDSGRGKHFLRPFDRVSSATNHAPRSGESREEKGFIRTIYTGKIAYHRGRKKSWQVHRGLETQRSHCLGRWFVSGEWKEVDSSANLASRSLSNPFYTTIQPLQRFLTSFFSFFFPFFCSIVAFARLFLYIVDHSVNHLY